MVFWPRIFRRYLRWNPIGGRSFLSNILCIGMVLFMFSLVATQLVRDPKNRYENQPHEAEKPLEKAEVHRPNGVPVQPDSNTWKNQPPPPQPQEIHRQNPQDSHQNSQQLQRNSVVAQIHKGGSDIKMINGEKYPKLSPSGKFIPIRRLVHLDLKGAAYRPAFFNELFAFFKRLNFTGILIEWEDMFPYTGKLAEALHGDAYSMTDVEQILTYAKEKELEVIPLVQTFGHLEWVLKLEKFAHLREDQKYPQVICFAAEEAWELVTDMIDQVASVHKKYGMPFFHMGADEVFQIGYCNWTQKEMSKQGGRDRVMLWHMSRTAKYIKEKHETTVLAWHDMFAHVMEVDLKFYNMTSLIEPMLWSYAEDLDQYLPFGTWIALKPFKNVWGASAIKGADGPFRFYTNPIHYIRNHDSWIKQMNNAWREFDYFQGLVFSAWSRYDHFAILAELLPVALPTLAMSSETILEGRPLGGKYPKSYNILQCNAPDVPGYARGCNFPGSKIYELVNEYNTQKQQIRRYFDSDYEYNGWLSNVAEKYHDSSPMYIDKIAPFVDNYLGPLERIEKDLRKELNKIYFDSTADEFVFTYMSEDLERLRARKKAAMVIVKRRTFEKRPYVEYPLKSDL